MAIPAALGTQGPDLVPPMSPTQAAAGSGQCEAAALLHVPSALPNLHQPQPVPGAAGPCPEADEVSIPGGLPHTHLC